MLGEELGDNFAFTPEPNKEENLYLKPQPIKGEWGERRLLKDSQRRGKKKRDTTDWARMRNVFCDED